MARVENAAQVRRSWMNSWPGVRPPSERAIRYNYQTYLQHGTNVNRYRGNSGRRRTVRSAQNIERVRRSLHRNGNVSSRRNGQNSSRCSFNRSVHCLGFHPYVLIKTQALLANDPAQRLDFCRWLLNMIEENDSFLANLVTSDEAVFSLNSEVNTKNVVKYSHYGRGHPRVHYVERIQGAGKVMVWLGFTGAGNVLGPYFVQRTLNTREYLRIVRYNVVQGDLLALGVDMGQLWWQQDGAPAHTSDTAMRYLQGQFPGKVISRRGDVVWPPRSPDFVVLDFFTWGYIKKQNWHTARNQQPRNIEQFKAAITRECRALSPVMIRSALHSSPWYLVSRARRCIAADGRFFES